MTNGEWTSVGVNGRPVREGATSSSRLLRVGYIAYPNPKLKNKIPDSRFYEFTSLKRRRGWPTSPSGLEFSTSGHLEQSVSKSQYIKKIAEIKELLAAGEIYQLNYAIRFRKKFSGSPYALFLKLIQINPTDFSVFMNCGNYQIISNSPERLFRVEKGRIITQPIKGTASKKAGVKKLLNSARCRPVERFWKPNSGWICGLSARNCWVVGSRWVCIPNRGNLNPM